MNDKKTVGDTLAKSHEQVITHSGHDYSVTLDERGYKYTVQRDDHDEPFGMIWHCGECWNMINDRDCYDSVTGKGDTVIRAFADYMEGHYRSSTDPFGKDPLHDFLKEPAKVESQKAVDAIKHIWKKSK